MIPPKPFTPLSVSEDWIPYYEMDYFGSTEEPYGGTSYRALCGVVKILLYFNPSTSLRYEIKCF